MILLENYINAYDSLVRFANTNCFIVFEPDNETHHEDIIDPILAILNNQQCKGVSRSQVTHAKMKNFIDAILRKGSFLLPYAVKNLKPADMKKLEEMCS